MNKLHVGLVQLAAGEDRRRNLGTAEALIGRLPEVDLIALPEVFAQRGNDADYRAAAEPIPGPTTEWLSRLAAARGAWVLGGSVIERDGDVIYNTSVLADRAGAIRTT